MRLTMISSLALATAAAAAADHWNFKAWDGLSCGDAPQNGQVFFSTEGIGERICISFKEGQRAYSYIAGYANKDTEVLGYFNEHCEGPAKVLQNNACTNPDVDVPYIRSMGINQVQ